MASGERDGHEGPTTEKRHPSIHRIRSFIHSLFIHSLVQAVNSLRMRQQSQQQQQQLSTRHTTATAATIFSAFEQLQTVNLEQQQKVNEWHVCIHQFFLMAFIDWIPLLAQGASSEFLNTLSSDCYSNCNKRLPPHPRRVGPINVPAPPSVSPADAFRLWP